MHSKLLSWLCLLGFFAVFTLQASAQQPAGWIKAAKVTGEVTATDKATNVTTAVANNQNLAQGAIVRTAKGASVVLVFSNGATVNLGTESELDVEQFTQDPFSGTMDASTMTDEPTTSTTKLKLTRGELVGKVAHLKTTQGSSFNINTPVGAAGIRGTTFRIVYRPDGTGKAFFSLTTVEGNVELSTAAANGTVTPPVAVTDNKEVVLADITVTVNDQTGQVTVTTSTGATVVVPTVTDAPATSTQQVLATVQQIAQAVANVVITPTPPSGGNGGGDTTPPQDNTTANPPKKNDTVTSGAGQ